MKCKGCGKRFTPKNASQAVCSFDCLMAYRVKEKTREARKVKKQYYANHLPTIFKKLQKEINGLARDVDYGLPCLAKGTYPNQMHGGHVFSVGSSNGMRFNLHNIHRQSAQSNHFQNEDGLLREGLKSEYGDAYFDFLNSMRGFTLPKESASYWNDILKTTREARREVQKSVNRILTVKERIELRNSLNNTLGIYPSNYSIFNF